MTAPPTADPFTATAPGARHAAYAVLAGSGPVSPVLLPNGSPAWLVTGQDENRTALTDPRFVKAFPSADRPVGGMLTPEIDAALNTDLLHLDPPDHTRLRRMVSAAFTRRRVEQLAPRIQEITDSLLDGMAGADRTDLITAFAYPLPIAVICDLLGVPADSRADFTAWSATLVSGPIATPAAWADAATALVCFVRELLVAKRSTPADDLLSALVAVRDGGDRLTEDELTSMVVLLLIAGHETTVNLIGNGVHALLTHPEQLARLRAEPERLPAVIEEVLRFDGPVQVATYRWTVEEVTLAGVALPAGALVIPGLLAAGRDPRRGAALDRFDITRPESPHLAFGHGIHHCLGAPLARLEGRIAIGSLLGRFPALRLAAPADQLVRLPGVLMNGLAALPVALHPLEES